jgi:hypothetical protein
VPRRAAISRGRRLRAHLQREWRVARRRAAAKKANSGIAVVWNVRKGERVGTFGEAYDTVLAVDISPDHKIIATGGRTAR